MDQQSIRFTTLDGRRIAYATVGEGPPLVLGGWWMSHLELDWRDPRFRAFIQALAPHRTVVRFDRPGTGLSADGGEPPVDLEGEVAVLSAVVDAVDAGPIDGFAASSGCPVLTAFAAAEPERVGRLILYGSYANGSEIASPEAREQLLAVVGRHWGLGSRVLADILMPTASGEERAAFAAFQRQAASAEIGVSSLASVYSFDVRDRLGAVRAPTLVLHRVDDTAIPIALGREVAAGIPGARFVTLDGVEHLPWRGNATAVVTAVLSELGIDEPVDLPAAGERPAPIDPAETDLSARELEVLKLVAVGLSDREIAEQLVLSPHTVHRHVANIRTKLRLPSRAAAAAYAARLGLI